MNTPATPDWKTVRDAMVGHLRSQLTAETPPELLTLMAKFEVKLKSLDSEEAFNGFNDLCAKVTEEVTAEFMKTIEQPMRIELLKRLTA